MLPDDDSRETPEEERPLPEPDELCALDAAQAAAAIREGVIGSEELVRACLQRIEALEPQIGAWTYVDPEHAIAQAREADEAVRRGAPPGPLHGVPIGVKDIFDTADMPTEDGSVLHAGRRPALDAAAVRRLREAGAVVLGKTVTTEFAVYAPGKTRNPHDRRRTPGGSSSGSAAAVAAHMVPLAIGSQTNGSVIRPASYCGVVGYKPTHGFISRHQMLQQSRRLDHVGVFARSLPDAGLAAEQMIGYDDMDPDTRLRGRFRLHDAALTEPPLTPRLALVRTAYWERVDPDARAAFEDLLSLLGDRGQGDELVLPEAFDEAWNWHRVIHESDLAHHLAKEYDEGAALLSDSLRAMIEQGRTHTAVAYRRAVESVELLTPLLERLAERWDALITPGTAGVAPLGLESTGSPALCTPWTLFGVPSVSLPLLEGEHGLPLGVQMVGMKGDDERLLRSAAWLAREVAAEAAGASTSGGGS